MSSTLPESLFPQSYKALLSSFSIIDRLFVFCTKRKLKTTKANFDSIYKSLGGSDGKALDFESLQRLQTLCGGANGEIILYYIPIDSSTLTPDILSNSTTLKSSSAFSIELSFPNCGGISENQIAKRRKMITTSLSVAIREYFESNVYAMGNDLNTKVKKSSKNAVWKAVISNAAWPSEEAARAMEAMPLPLMCPLPPIPVSLQNTSALDPFQHSTQNIIAVGRTGVASPIKSSTSSSSSSSSLSNALTDENNNFQSGSTSSDDDDIVQAVSISSLGGGVGLLEYLKTLPFYESQVEHVHIIPPREAKYTTLSSPLRSELLVEALHHELNLTMDKLYSHQARAINVIRDEGKHVVVATSTASGKSVIYNIPVIEKILEDRNCTALYLFPIKALAQDQIRVLNGLCSAIQSPYPVRAVVCDGDTPSCERNEIKKGKGSIILTNPDMLHLTLLPGHREWKRLFQHLRFVVIDEMHQYTGAWGCHVSMIMRRLIRICLLYGARPQFIFCSATIANPADHASKLVPLHCLTIGNNQGTINMNSGDESQRSHHNSLVVIDKDMEGSPQGERVCVIWNPPRTKDADEGAAASAARDVEAMGLEFQVNQETSDEIPPTCIECQAPLSCDTDVVSLAFDGKILERNGDSQSSMPEKSISPPPTSNNEVTQLSVSPISKDEDANSTTSTGVEPMSTHSRETFEKEAVEEFVESCSDRPDTWGKPGEKRKGSGRQRGVKRKVRISNQDGDASDGKEQGYGDGRGVEMALHDSSNENQHQDENSKGTYQNLDTSNEYINHNSEGGESCIIFETENLKRERTSTIVEMAMLFSALVKRRLRILSFCRVRKLVELVLKYTLQDLNATARHLTSMVSSYRSGYEQSIRRKIEQDLFNGRLLGVTTTCALELGVDIGNLDVSLHMGFPGSHSSLWQQMGRAGRSGGSSLSIIVCFDSPVDQYFARNPKELWEMSAENAVINVDNQFILRSHLICAAKEEPLNSQAFIIRDCRSVRTIQDTLIWGKEFSSVCEYLIGISALCRCSSSSNLLYLHPHYNQTPAKECSIRNIDPESIDIVNSSTRTTMDSLIYSRAFFELFEGAIYMHMGKQYLVTKLDLTHCTAYCHPVKVNYYTRAHNDTSVQILKVIDSRYEDGTTNLVKCGSVQIVSKVGGYSKHRLGSGEVIENGDCSLPPLSFETRAVWIDIPLSDKKKLEELCGNVNADIIGAALHTSNHAVSSIAPIFAQCDANDFGTEHLSASHPPYRMLFFDKRPGGLGISDALFDNILPLLQKALALLESCPCTPSSGCYSCSLDSSCADYNKNLHKKAAIILLKLLILRMKGNSGDGNGMSERDDEMQEVRKTVTNNPIQSPMKAAIAEHSKRRSKFMDTGHTHSTRRLTIENAWTEANPTFVTDYDLSFHR